MIGQGGEALRVVAADFEAVRRSCTAAGLGRKENAMASAGEPSHNAPGPGNGKKGATQSSDNPRMPHAETPTRSSPPRRSNKDSLPCCFCNNVDRLYTPSIPFPVKKASIECEQPAAPRHDEDGTRASDIADTTQVSSPNETTCPTCFKFKYESCKACKRCQTLFAKQRSSFFKAQHPAATFRQHMSPVRMAGRMRRDTWPRMEKYLSHGKRRGDPSWLGALVLALAPGDGLTPQDVTLGLLYRSRCCLAQAWHSDVACVP